MGHHMRRALPAMMFGKIVRMTRLFTLAVVWPAVGCSPTAGVAPATEASAQVSTEFKLVSSAFQAGGALPVVHTCDGAGHSPPLAWSGAPHGTVQFALLMTTLANDGMRWNWVLYGIPAGVTSLAESTAGVGTAGLSSDGPLLQYYPPCSQGPGAKTYTFTIYALSAAPTFSVPASQVSGPVLTSAISQVTLSSATISVTYTR